MSGSIFTVVGRRRCPCYYPYDFYGCSLMCLSGNQSQSVETDGKRKSSLLRRWYQDFLASTKADNGWRLVGKSFLVTAGLCGLLLTLITYLASVRSADFDRAHQQLQVFRERIRSDDAAQRAMALADAPRLLTLRAHANSQVGPLEALLVLLGVDSGGEPVFTEHVRTDVTAYLYTHGTRELTDEESESLIHALRQIQRSGWLHGKNHQSIPGTRGALTWLWTPEELGQDEHMLEPLRKALRKTNLKGIEFVGDTLTNADFSNARFNAVSFARSDLGNGRFRSTLFTDCKLEVSRFVGANLQKAAFVNTEIRGSVLSSVRADESMFKRCFLIEVDFRAPSSDPKKWQDTTLSRVIFDSCNMTQIDFSYATLTGAVFTGDRSTSVRWGATASKFIACDLSTANLNNSTFEDSDFKLADMSGASAEGANFRYCNFAHATLDRANMRKCDFTGAYGIAPGDNPQGNTINSCDGLLLENAVGLTALQLKFLQSRGAKLTSDLSQ